MGLASVMPSRSISADLARSTSVFSSCVRWTGTWPAWTSWASIRTEASSSARPTGAGSLNMPGAVHSSSRAWGATISMTHRWGSSKYSASQLSSASLKLHTTRSNPSLATACFTWAALRQVRHENSPVLSSASRRRSQLDRRSKATTICRTALTSLPGNSVVDHVLVLLPGGAAGTMDAADTPGHFPLQMTPPLLQPTMRSPFCFPKNRDRRSSPFWVGTPLFTPQLWPV